MFLREVRRRNKNGTQVSYLQLVHNQWDAAAQASRTKILYSFGRTDQVDPAAIQRLIASLSRLLDPAAALRVTASSELTLLASRPLGGAHVLDGMWHRLGIDKVLRKLRTARRDPRVERVLFALVANRALDASSSSPPPAGSTTTCTSTACQPPATMPATGPWTGYWRSRTRWSGRSSGRSRPYWTSKSTCCSSTRPRPTSSWTPPTPPWRGTSAAPRCPTPPAATVRCRRPGFAPMASPRTTATTCRISSSGWRSPAPSSRSGCGAGRATPPTPP